MWILHTSDLCITPSNAQCRPLLERLAQWVLKTTRDKPVDFVIVAGNITRDGRRESFDAAHDHLKWLCDAIAVKDLYQNGASGDELPRLAVSPGQNDCGDGGAADDLTAFDEFVSRISPGGKDGRTVSAGATCRELKDITIVCVPYWTPRRPFFDKLADEWGSMQLPDSRYARHTPTLLVTAQCPALAAEGSHRLFEPIRGLRDALEVELHLFGSGPVAALLPEPFGLDRLALGTGPKEGGTPWPFRANLLELSYRGKHGTVEATDQIYMANHVFQELRPCEPDWKDHFRGEVSLFFPPRPARQANGHGYSSFLGELAKLICDHRKYIVLYGLPGIGDQEFIEQAREATKWGDCPVRVIHDEITGYEATDEASLIKRLSSQLKRLSSGTSAEEPGHRVVVLLRDRQPSGLPSEQRQKLQRFIEQKLRKLVLKYNCSVVFLLAYLDYSLDLSGEMMPESLPLPPLTPNEMDGLIESYESSVPIGSPRGTLAQDVSRLTGRYAGYARLLLDRAKNLFSNQPGIEPVSPANSRLLLQRAMQHDAIAQTSLQSVKSIEIVCGGSEVCTYIRHAVREATAGDHPSSPVLLSLAAMQASAPKHLHGDVTYVFDRLAQLNVIRARTGSDDQYELLLTAPFLPQPWSARAWSSGGGPNDNGAVRVKSGNGTARGHGSNDRELSGGIAMDVDILLLTALPEEKDALLAELARVGRHEPLDPQPGDAFAYDRAVLPFTTGQGRQGQYSIAVASTDRGRVRAATVAAHALARWNPKYVVLVGIAGGVADAGVKVGDVLIADQVLDSALRKLHDQSEEIRWKVFQVDRGLLAAAQDWRSRFLPPPGPVPPVTHFGTVVSGDDVVARRRVAEEMSKLLVRLVGFEMEAAGVAEAVSCAPARPGFFMVRAVSDLADADKDTPAIAARRSHVCEVAAAFAVQLLATGPIAIAAPASDPASQPPRRSATGSNPPPGAAASLLTVDQQNALADHIARSPFAMNHIERRALCRSIGVAPGQNFVESGVGRSFGQELVGHLVDLRNQSSIDLLVLRLVEVYVNDPSLEALLPTTRG